MGRKKREVSNSGVYHVCLRGNNRQVIFLDRNDFESFLGAVKYAQDSISLAYGVGVVLYAYVLMHNHVHMLLQANAGVLSEFMFLLENRFVTIYNAKYERSGHLFQDRFRSYPVETADSFKRVFCYIHNNPVKSGEVASPEDYRWSSWRDYLRRGSVNKGAWHFYSELCSIDSVIRRFGLDDLKECVNKYDVDESIDRLNINDEEAWAMLSKLSGMSSPSYFSELPKEVQVGYIKLLCARGLPLSQAARLSGLPYAYVWRKVHEGE